MNRTERLYGIVEELRLAGAAGRTSTWLAERFRVSVRTIKRDMAALARAEQPTVATEGRAGGYRLLRAAALPPLTFTTGEATAVTIALAAEPELPFGSDGRAALVKVLGAMAPAQRRTAADLARKVWYRQPTRRSDPRWTSVLEEALRDDVAVTIDHEDDQGSVTRRLVEPLGFARTRGAWWLMAWCRQLDAPEWFRLDRIVGAHATRERAEPRDLRTVFGTPPPDAHPVELDV